MSTPPFIPPLFPQKFSGVVTVPGSKSITNRFFPLAVLAGFFSNTPVYFSGALESEDSEIMQKALQKMGAHIEPGKAENSWNIEAGTFFSDASDYEIFCGNSGTTIRFLTALCALRKGKTTLTGVERMKSRPIRDLASAIEQLGAHVNFPEKNGFPPLIISPVVHWETIEKTQKISLSGKLSSQFFTALFHIAPMFPEGVEISVEGDLVSKPYIDMTLSVLADFGIEVENVENAYQKFVVQGSKRQKISAPQNLQVEGDASGASYPLAIGCITGGGISIQNLPENMTDSIQGDAKFSEIVIHKMYNPSEKFLKPLGKIDLEDIPDVAMTAVVLCAYAKGVSEISGLSTLRHKECDRIFALESNLKKMGVRVESTVDTITIYGNPEKIHGANIECFGDHRVAMCFAVLATRVEGVTILDPDCVQKTYPTFWEEYQSWRTGNF